MKIIPIKTGTIHCNKGLTTTLGRGIDKWIDIPSISWLIVAKDRKILVDTGMCSTEKAQKYHYPGAVQNEDQRIDLALMKTGFKAEDIDTVVLTHLHWDHSQNLDFFKNAKFYVQKKELDFAKKPIPPYYSSYDYGNNEFKPSFESVKFNVLNGDEKITEGIEVFMTPGHSPGHQSVLVKTEKGNYVIAGDAVMCYENLEKHPTKGILYTMIGRYMDIEKSWKSIERIMKKAGGKEFVLPAHEEKIFEHDKYPS